MSNTYYLKEAIRGALYSNTLNEASPAVINRLLEMMKAEGERLIQGFDAIKKNGENVRFQIVNNGTSQSLRLVINLYAGWTKKSFDEIDIAYRAFVDKFSSNITKSRNWGGRSAMAMFRDKEFKWNGRLDQPRGNTIDMEVVDISDFVETFDAEYEKNREAYKSLDKIEYGLVTFINRLYDEFESRLTPATKIKYTEAGRLSSEIVKEWKSMANQTKSLLAKVRKAKQAAKDEFGDDAKYW